MSRLTRLVCIALLASCSGAFAGEDAQGRRAILEVRQRVNALAAAADEFKEAQRTATQISEEIDAWKKQAAAGAADTDAVKQQSIKNRLDDLAKQLNVLATNAAAKKPASDTTAPSDNLSTGDGEARRAILVERARVEYWEREWKLPVKNWEAMGWGSLFSPIDNDLRAALLRERQTLDKLAQEERVDLARLKLFVERLSNNQRQLGYTLQVSAELGKQSQQQDNERQGADQQRTSWEKELKAALQDTVLGPRKLALCPKDARAWNNCFGEFVGPGGGKYVGEWRSNQYDGWGIYTAANGDRYAGQFKANQYQGRGSYHYANGERYLGEVKEGKKYGQGVLYAANGAAIEDGFWVADVAPSVKRAEEARGVALAWKSRIQSEVATLRQKPAENKVWTDVVSKAVLNTLRRWLEDTGSLNIQEIPAPVFPVALSLVQEKWESDKEFEERLAAARAERQREIEKIQNTYKAQVEQRNKNVQQVNAARAAKERIASLVRKEFTEMALTLVEPQVLVAGSSFDPRRAILYLDVKIDGAAPTRFEFADAPLALRKAALTDMAALKLSAEVGVSPGGEFGLKGVKAVGAGANAVGVASQGAAAVQAVRQVTIDLPSATATGVLTQQSVLAVDGNQVERILYREENDALRKRLEEQRRSQESALAGESRKAAEEVAKYKAEAQALAEVRRKLEEDLAQREQAKKASRIALQASVSLPDANGEVLITIKTGADTSSLLLNGEEMGGKADGSYSIRKVARVGQDTVFTIVGRDINGNTDTKTLKVARQVSETKLTFARLNAANVKVQPKRDAVAIIIGIAAYANLPRADYANEDAREFFNYANRGLGIAPENIKMLIDGDAKQLDILRTFKAWLPQRVKPTTDVYVFYSGHGLPSADGKGLYLLPVGTDKDYVDKTAVLQSEINAALQAAKPQSVTLFLDSCYSGLAKTGETLVASARPMALTSAQNAFPAEFTVISAAQQDQISSSNDELKHGIFSYFLMRGMEGDADENRDGRITVGEMHGYLKDQVMRKAGAVNRIQIPQLAGDPQRVLVYR